MALKVPISGIFATEGCTFSVKLLRKLFSDFLLVLPVEIRICFEEIVERGNPLPQEFVD